MLDEIERVVQSDVLAEYGLCIEGSSRIILSRAMQSKDRARVPEIEREREMFRSAAGERKVYSVPRAVIKDQRVGGKPVDERRRRGGI